MNYMWLENAHAAKYTLSIYSEMYYYSNKKKD